MKRFLSVFVPVIVAVATVVLAAAAAVAIHANRQADPIFEANIEALTQSEPTEGLMQYVCKYLGCCGGQNKCFSGEVSINGVTISGTFYMN